MPPKKVLLVDDSGASRMFHRSLITQNTAYEVETAGDGQEALNKAFQEHFDLIVMDIMMPRIDGLTACRILKNDERTRNIPVILLTFKSGEDSVQEGVLSGCDDYLMKPVEASEFVKILEKYIGASTMAKSHAGEQ